MLRLLLLTPEYEGAGGGISTFYRMLAPALRAANVEVRVIEGSAVHTTKDRREQAYDGIRIETLEHDRLNSLVGPISRVRRDAGTPPPFGGVVGHVGAGGVWPGLRYRRGERLGSPLHTASHRAGAAARRSVSRQHRPDCC